MFHKKFYFFKQQTTPKACYVSAEDLYSPESGFGFVTEKNRDQQSNLQIGELNAGFAAGVYQ
jgi:hypothetical protein